MAKIDESSLKKLSIVLTLEDLALYLCQYHKEFSLSPSIYSDESNYMDLYDPSQINGLIGEML